MNFILASLLHPVPVILELLSIHYLSKLKENNLLIYKFAIIPLLTFLIAGLMPHMNGIGMTGV